MGITILSTELSLEPIDLSLEVFITESLGRMILESIGGNPECRLTTAFPRLVTTTGSNRLAHVNIPYLQVTTCPVVSYWTVTPLGNWRYDTFS